MNPNFDELIKLPSEEIDEPEEAATPRTQARRVALQALYQWVMNGDEPYLIEKQFSEAGWFSGIDRDLFVDLFRSVVNQAEDLDAAFEPFLDRSIKMINPVELTVLRLATYELQTQIQIPYKVVMNEAIELSKRFGAHQAHKYINGVLDKLAKELRPLEFSA